MKHANVSLEVQCKSNVTVNLQISKNLYQNVSGPFISVKISILIMSFQIKLLKYFTALYSRFIWKAI
jgi:hypothetical protein